MIIDKLVQNFFERKGTFNGITDTSIGNELKKMSKDNNESVTALCYRFLGYDGVKDPVAYMQTRVRVLRGDESVLAETGYTDFKELRRDLNMSNIKIPDAQPELDIGGIKNLDKLVGEYYRQDIDNTIMTEKGPIPFGVWLCMNPSISMKDLVNSEASQCLVTNKVQKGDPIVYRGVLYTPKALTEKELYKVNSRAVHRAMYKNDIYKHWIKIPLSDLVILSTINKQKYLEIMDYAIATGVTYASVVEKMGLNVPNLFIPYNHNGYACIKFNQHVLYATDEKEQWKVQAVEEFLMMLGLPEFKPPVPRTDFRKTTDNCNFDTDCVKTIKGGELHAISCF